MKKAALILILILAVVNLKAQEENKYPKGFVSFNFNKVENQGPVTNIIIRKENKIIISIRYEYDFRDFKGEFSLEFGVNDLTAGTKIIDEYTSLNYRSSKKSSKDEYKLRSFTFAARDNRAVYTSAYERFEYADCPTNIYLDEVSYKSGKIIIKGRFDGTYVIPEGQSKEVGKSEIKDGKFEIVL